MLEERELDRLASKLEARTERLNTYLIQKIAQQLNMIGKMNPTQLRRVLQSVKYGNDLNDIITALVEYTDLTQKDIYEIFEEVAKKNQAFAKQFYLYRDIDFIPYEQNKELQQLVKAVAIQTANSMKNISNTFAFTFKDASGNIKYSKLSDIYQQLTDEAIMLMETGQETYEQASARIMKEIAGNGIQRIEYSSGYKMRADSAVRMNLMEGVRTLENTIGEQFGKEFEADGVEVVHHKNPAPDHSSNAKLGWHDIDGQQFSTNGRRVIDGKTYKDFNQVNNSLNRPVSTLNCYHFTVPIVLGVSKPIYDEDQLIMDKDANLSGFDFEGKHYTNYEGTQLQRALERKIRSNKDLLTAYKELDNETAKELEEKTKKRIRQLTEKYNKLSKISGLPTRVQRLKTYK